LATALSLVKKMSHPGTGAADQDRVKELSALADDCFQNMSDDFNTAKTLAVLFEMSSRINDLHTGLLPFAAIDPETFVHFKNTYVQMLEEVLGLPVEEEGGGNLLEGAVQVLIELRKKARIDRNFQLSDKIRDDLKGIGIQLKDGKDGAMTWEIG
ncbi:MAG: DALR domain-containing protein, partial [Bacteroidota bacterium]